MSMELEIWRLYIKTLWNQILWDRFIMYQVFQVHFLQLYKEAVKGGMNQVFPNVTTLISMKPAWFKTTNWAANLFLSNV